MNNSVFKSFGFVEKIFLFAFVLVVVSDVTTGLARYYLQAAGLIWLAYLPKALAVALAIIYSFHRKTSNSYFVLMFVAVSFGFVGLLNGLPFLQIGFGLWIFSPVFFGVVAINFLNVNRVLVLKICFIALSISLFGIVLNTLTSVPWTNSSFALAGQTIENAREWTISEFNRPAGFARMSSQASQHILLFGILIIPSLRRKSLFTAIIVSIACLLGIVLTTTKSALLAFLIIVPFALFAYRRLFRFVFIFVCLASFLIPLSTVSVNYSIGSNNWIFDLFIASFDERLGVTWPQTIALLNQEATLLIGRGLGGLGTAEQLFGYLSLGDSSLFGIIDLSVADNYPLYLMGNFGIFGVIFYFYQVYAAIKLSDALDDVHRGVGFALATLLVMGSATDSIESLSSAVIVGLGFGAVFAKSSKSQVLI